jgi:hypothetical protein
MMLARHERALSLELGWMLTYGRVLLACFKVVVVITIVASRSDYPSL